MSFHVPSVCQFKCWFLLIISILGQMVEMKSSQTLEGNTIRRRHVPLILRFRKDHLLVFNALQFSLTEKKKKKYKNFDDVIGLGRKPKSKISAPQWEWLTASDQRRSGNISLDSKLETQRLQNESQRCSWFK